MKTETQIKELVEKEIIKFMNDYTQVVVNQNGNAIGITQVQAYYTNELVKLIKGYTAFQNEMQEDVGSSHELTPKYRLMIYFAHSTMVIYSKTIISNEKMSVGEFMEQNKEVIKRVFDEGLTIMEYELSHEQMGRASYVYLQSKYYPSSVLERKVFVPQPPKH